MLGQLGSLGAGLGTLGILGGASTPPVVSSGFILLADGSSFILLADGTSKLKKAS